MIGLGWSGLDRSDVKALKVDNTRMYMRQPLVWNMPLHPMTPDVLLTCIAGLHGGWDPSILTTYKICAIHTQWAMLTLGMCNMLDLELSIERMPKVSRAS